MNVLSYGGGVQTRAAVQLIVSGEIAKPDVVMFSDTGDEMPQTYQGVAEDERLLRSVNVPFVTTRHKSGKSLSQTIIDGPGSIYAGFYIFAGTSRRSISYQILL